MGYIMPVVFMWLLVTITFTFLIVQEGKSKKQRNDPLFKICSTFLGILWLCLTVFEFVIVKTLYHLNF